MLILPTEEAQAGMKLAAPVLHPDRPDQQLLRRGFALDDAIIARLREIHVDFIYVDYPSLDHLDRHLSVYLSPARQQILGQIKTAFASVQTQARPKIAYADYVSTTRDLITTLMEQGRNPIYLDQMARAGADAVTHAGAVAHLSLLLGLKLEQYVIGQRPRLSPNRAKDLVNLGVAGMLHDVGMAQLPEELRGYTEADPPADPEQLRQWQSHVRLGYDAIHASVEPTAAAAVLQHHQHLDGSGFPSLSSGDAERGPMAGERIHIFARIILAANLYDRLVSPPSGPRRPASLVHPMLRSKYGAWIDPVILSVLRQVVPPYAPGSRVKLSDGTRAIVIDVDPDDPARPTIKRLAAKSLEVTDALIDLKKITGLQIQEPVAA